MKKMLIIIDGAGDLPCRQFNGKTPLESANMKNLNELSRKSKLGFMYPVSEDYAPESDTAITSILGNDFLLSSRGEFEAIGRDIKLRRGDLVMRANFGTVDNLQSRKILDRRAGRTLTTSEAEQLAEAINKNVKLSCKFQFFSTVQHRGILIFFGGFSDNITNTDTYMHEKGKIWVKGNFDWAKPLDDDENTEYTSNLLNSFVDQSFKILENHPINQLRRKKGLLPANIILTRDTGIEKPKLRKFSKAMAIVNMPLEKGIAKCSEMDVFSFDYPQMKSYDVYEHLYHGLREMMKFSIKTIEKQSKDYNFCFIHFKETDVPGHDNKPIEKKNLLKMIDEGFFNFLTKYAEKEKVQIIVTADHSTPCKMKTHTSDPVPVLVFDPSEKGDNLDFNEENSKKGSLGKIFGKDLLKKTGFIS
jgi:2,3-bisphosphoglycerate-independent phosphoglycerate mutase